MMEHYCHMGKVDHSSQAKLFRGIVQTKGEEWLHNNGGQSYTRVRWLLEELLQLVLTQCCLESIAFGQGVLRQLPMPV